MCCIRLDRQVGTLRQYLVELKCERPVPKATSGHQCRLGATIRETVHVTPHPSVCTKLQASVQEAKKY